jgi:hypothetical protein
MEISKNARLQSQGAASLSILSAPLKTKAQIEVSWLRAATVSLVLVIEKTEIGHE